MTWRYEQWDTSRDPKIDRIVERTGRAIDWTAVLLVGMWLGFLATTFWIGSGR